MLAIHLEGSLPSTAPGKHCADHDRTSPSEGGAEIRLGIWVCAKCLRRRLARTLAGTKPVQPTASMRAQNRSAAAEKLLDRTRTAWGLDQSGPVGKLTPEPLAPSRGRGGRPPPRG